MVSDRLSIFQINLHYCVRNFFRKAKALKGKELYAQKNLILKSPMGYKPKPCLFIFNRVEALPLGKLYSRNVVTANITYKKNGR